MNITLSAQEELVRKARKHARERNTTINQIIREYLAKLVGEASNEEVARDYEAVATSMAGRSPEGWRFDRATRADNARGSRP